VMILFASASEIARMLLRPSRRRLR